MTMRGSFLPIEFVGVVVSQCRQIKIYLKKHL
jgi:hypothetical protein